MVSEVDTALDGIVRAIRHTISTYTPMGPMTEQEHSEWEAHRERIRARKEAMAVLGLTERDLDLLREVKERFNE